MLQKITAILLDCGTYPLLSLAAPNSVKDISCCALPHFSDSVFQAFFRVKRMSLTGVKQ